MLLTTTIGGSGAPTLVLVDLAARPSGHWTIERGRARLHYEPVEGGRTGHIGTCVVLNPPLPITGSAPYQAHSTESREAAATAEFTRGPAHERILALLADRGPLTDEAIAELLELSPNTARPRRIELVDAGLVRRAGTGMTRSNHKAALWGLRGAA